MNQSQMFNRIEALEKELESLKTKCTTNPLPQMVKIPERNYKLAETPVTVAQYKHYCSAVGKDMPEQPGPVDDENPVTNVTWADANQYCIWLSQELGEECRLPSEDEFEYCCADHKQGTEETAVFDKACITQVKTKEQNKFGLYDMLGLVWEWQNS